MESKEKKFEEQDHPLKNTDQAFVKVGKNGEPVIPNVDDKKEYEQRDNDLADTTERR